MCRSFAVVLVLLAVTARATAQPPNASIGEAVPRDVREIYDKGLQYLVKAQTERGDFRDGMQGPGITGMARMVFLASGEDPNEGLYSNNARPPVRRLATHKERPNAC